MIWDNSFALSVLPVIAQGLATTVLITITGTAIAMCIGLVLAIMRRARTKWISLPAEAFVEFVRATPCSSSSTSCTSGFLPSESSCRPW